MKTKILANFQFCISAPLMGPSLSTVTIFQMVFLSFFKILIYIEKLFSEFLFWIAYYPVDTGRKLNVHKSFRRRPGRLLNILCTFNLRPVFTG